MLINTAFGYTGHSSISYPNNTITTENPKFIVKGGEQINPPISEVPVSLFSIIYPIPEDNLVLNGETDWPTKITGINTENYTYDLAELFRAQGEYTNVSRSRWNNIYVLQFNGTSCPIKLLHLVLFCCPCAHYCP